MFYHTKCIFWYSCILHTYKKISFNLNFVYFEEWVIVSINTNLTFSCSFLFFSIFLTGDLCWRWPSVASRFEGIVGHGFRGKTVCIHSFLHVKVEEEISFLFYFFSLFSHLSLFLLFFLLFFYSLSFFFNFNISKSSKRLREIFITLSLFAFTEKKLWDFSFGVPDIGRTIYGASRITYRPYTSLTLKSSGRECFVFVEQSVCQFWLYLLICWFVFFIIFA